LGGTGEMQDVVDAAMFLESASRHGDLETVTGVRAAGHMGEIFENDHHRH